MTSELGSIFASGILSILLLCIGYGKGFFKIQAKEWDVPLRFIHLVGGFAIYFLATYALSALAVTFLKKQMTHHLSYASWFNFAISLAIFCSLAIYWKFLPTNVRMGIVLREKFSFQGDVRAAFYSWILSFPLVLFLSHLLEQVIFKVFHITRVPDQIAVKFVKSTFEYPLYFTLAVLSITILAPLIEETLFRGFLQSYIRRHLGRWQAIFITSVCFSSFHYSSEQGLGNISIIVPLFFLSLFLGFLYEKQGSIFASMTLHASFNAISILNLYLFGGFTSSS